MLSDYLRTKPLREWTYEDFTSIKDAEESIGLELKSDLPLNNGARGWRTAGKIHKSERDGIAKEIVALANSYGGDLLIGINETDDHPKRAAGPANKLLNVDKLVDEIKRSLSALIDPPIAGVEIQAIKETSEKTEGYITIRVPSSLNKPHGFGTPTAAYIRKDDRSEPMNMRVLQDRFFEAQTSRQRIDEEIAQCSFLNSELKQVNNSLTASFALIPSHSLEQKNLLQLVNHHNFNSLRPNTISQSNRSILREPSGGDWQPNAFGIVAKFPRNNNTNNPTSIWNIRDNGSIHASGIVENKKISTGDDVEVFPFMISVATTHLISLQTALIKATNSPSLNWYFVCEIQSDKEKVYVRTDKEWGDYKSLSLSSPVKIKPIRIMDAYDTDGINLIEQKICNIFELGSDPYGKIISFEK